MRTTQEDNSRTLSMQGKSSYEYKMIGECVIRVSDINLI